MVCMMLTVELNCCAGTGVPVCVCVCVSEKLHTRMDP